MPKKIFDVIPPKRESIVRKEEYIEKPVMMKRAVKNPDLIKEIVTEIEKKGKISEPKKRPKIFKAFLSICLLLLVVGFAGIVINSLISIKVKVKVWPKIDNFTAEKSMTASLSLKEVDYEKGILPGQLVSETKSLEKEFQATGKKNKEEKAKGVVRVYNSYSDAPQVLIAGTRFVSSDGKLFKITAKQTIAGGKYSGGKLVAGETDVSVEASETGDGYNIGPATFSIPGFSGTPKYTAIYGKSLLGMTAGAKKEVSIVLQDDLDKAEVLMAEETKKSGIDSLKNSISKDLVLIDNSAVQTIKEKVFSAKAGDEAEKFTIKADVDSSGVAFKKSDIQTYFESLVNNGIPKGDQIKSDSMVISYSFKSVDYKDKEISGISFSATTNAKFYKQLDLEKMKEGLLGKSFEEVKSILSDGSLKVSKVEISPGVFWRKSMPKTAEKVDMSLEVN
jgi:hypothetical protein